MVSHPNFFISPLVSPYSLCFCLLACLPLIETNVLSLILTLLILFVNLTISLYFFSRPGSLALFLVFLLLLTTLAFATTSSLLFFYVFFEASLLPVLGITFLLGYQPEKVAASLYLLVYTVVGSVPLLIITLRVIGCVFTGLVTLSGFTSLCVSVAFMVKAPAYTLHVWLPKAHVESPLLGSMLLSGVILKLGAYGFIVMSPSFGSYSHI